MIMLVLYFLLVIVVWHQDRLIKGRQIDCTINEPMLFDENEDKNSDSSSSPEEEAHVLQKESSRDNSCKINTPIEVLYEKE